MVATRRKKVVLPAPGWPSMSSNEYRETSSASDTGPARPPRSAAVSWLRSAVYSCSMGYRDASGVRPTPLPMPLISMYPARSIRASSHGVRSTLEAAVRECIGNGAEAVAVRVRLEFRVPHEHLPSALKVALERPDPHGARRVQGSPCAAEGALLVACSVMVQPEQRRSLEEIAELATLTPKLPLIAPRACARAGKAGNGRENRSLVLNRRRGVPSKARRADGASGEGFAGPPAHPAANRPLRRQGRKPSCCVNSSIRRSKSPFVYCIQAEFRATTRHGRLPAGDR